MAHGELMKKLLTSYGRSEESHTVVEQVILEEEQKNNRILAKSPRHTLDSATSADVHLSKQLPSQKLAPLIPFPDAANDFVKRVEPIHSHKDITLSHANTRTFDGLLQEYRRSEEIRHHGSAVRAKPLFCGSPGCGKTLCAEVFVAELGLPLSVAKLDRLISFYLGETAGNIRKIFEFARRQSCALFPDEFDALARSHDDSVGRSELCRVVNNLLLSIDRMQPHGFMIVVTNLDSSLDPVTWRRFDEIIWFDKSDQTLIKRFLNTKFKSAVISFGLDKYVDRLESYSFAEIGRIYIQAIKVLLIARRKGIAGPDFTAAITDENRRRARCARF